MASQYNQKKSARTSVSNVSISTLAHGAQEEEMRNGRSRLRGGVAGIRRQKRAMVGVAAADMGRKMGINEKNAWRSGASRQQHLA